MTMELVLLLFVYMFILLGVFNSDKGPAGVFRESGPRLAAKLEKDVSVGHGFTDARNGTRVPKWKDDGVNP